MINPNYKWLESIRLLRQKTQKEVASDLGISQGKLSKAEQGIQSLSEDILSKLADYYDVPLSYFSQEWDETPISHAYFRKKITIPVKVFSSIEAEIQRRKCVIEELMSSIDIPEYDLGHYDLDNGISIYEVVANVRYMLKCINGPLSDLAKRIENHGVLIQTFDFGTDKMDGLSTLTRHGYNVIFLNSRMPNDRKRFSLAHELGHLVMHIGQNISNDRNVEDEADKFASQILMPENEIKHQLYCLNFSILLDLKSYWKVSMHALVKRALDLGTMSQETYRNFQINFSKKGYTKIEPGMIPDESGTILEDSIRLYQSELGYTDGELMRMMYLNESDFYEWFKSANKPFRISIKRV